MTLLNCLRDHHRSWHFHATNEILIRPVPQLPRLFIERHVPHRIRRLGTDRHRRHPTPRFGIEGHERIGLNSRLGHPYPILIVRRHSIWKGRWPRRHRELLDLPRRRVEPAEEAARVVTVPDDPVRGHRDAPRTRAVARERGLLALSARRYDRSAPPHT